MRDRGLARACTLLTVSWLAFAGLARADMDIDIRGVNDELRNNVLAYLSLVRYKDRALDAATIERLQGRVEREVKDALRPFGYYTPTVKSEITERQRASWHAVIDIDPGPPVLMESVDVRVTGPGAADPRFRRIVEHPLLAPGERLRHAAYEQMKNELQRTAGTYGYLDARFTRSELRVDLERSRASAALVMETGERYAFGATTIEETTIDQKLVRRYMRYHEGEPFDATEVLRTQFALDDSQYFSTVEVLPGEPDHTRRTVPMTIRAQPNRHDRYSFSGGYGTDTGPRGTVQWDRRWLGPGGDRITTQFEASQILLLLQSFYIIPIGDPATEKFAVGATADYGTPADLIYKDLAAGPALTRVIGRFQYVFSLMPTHASTYDGNVTRIQNLLIPTVTMGSVPRGYLGEPLFQQGFVAQLRAGTSLTHDQCTPSALCSSGSAKFLQLHVQAQRTIQIASGWHLWLRAEAGATLVSNLNELPGALRFFAGGEGSVRGFAFDDLSPVIPKLNPDGTPNYKILLKVGGRDVLTGTTELERDLPRNLGIAVFTDAGNAFDVFGHSPNPAYPHFLEYSAGIGLRWRVPVVTVGIDIAQPLSRPGEGPKFDIYFGPKL